MTLRFWLIRHYSNLSFRVLGPGMQFQHKLHIVYLVNDILHHCQRKGAQDLKKSLEDIIVPLFFCTQIGESPENLQKITKVLGIWESHNLFEASLLQVTFLFPLHLATRGVCVRENSPKKICAHWLVKNCVSIFDRNTELALAVDVMMAQAKRIYILMIKSNKLFPSFLLRCF